MYLDKVYFHFKASHFLVDSLFSSKVISQWKYIISNRPVCGQDWHLNAIYFWWYLGRLWVFPWSVFLCFVCFFYWFYFFLFVILWSINVPRVHDVSSIFSKISVTNQIKIFVFLLNSKGWLWFLCLRFSSGYCHSKFEIILAALTFRVECFEITSKVLCLLENFDLF